MYAWRGTVGLVKPTFKGDLNPKFASFFEEAGLEVAAMKGCTEMSFSDLEKIPAEEIYVQAKKVFVETGGGDCLYLLVLGGTVSARLSRWSAIFGPAWLLT
jgi:maleate cis-trans isomerase